MPEELKVDTFIFDVSDRPLWLTKFIRQYFNQSLISVNYRENMTDRREIYIKFEKIFEISNKAEKRIERFFASKLPNHVDALIFYSDEGSVFLKQLILDRYQSVEHIVEETEINNKKELLRDKNILVVSATINSGRRLVDTSLKLRDLNCKGICYFVGMSRTPDEYTIDVTRKYIGFDNVLGRDVNPLIIVDSIFLSDINIASTFNRSSISSWQEEKNFIEKFPINREDFKSRINEVNADSLINNLFWSDCNKKELRLRDNFAFYIGTGKKTDTATQAEVFFLLNAVLHNVRRNPNKKIFQSAFHRHVLSPETFLMYNDGIIQASILRSATPIELNYNFFGSNMKIANEMLNVLRYVFNNFNNEIGESTIEFLIALCTKRLQVIKKELKIIIDNLISKVEASDVKNKQVILSLCNQLNTDLSNEVK